MDHRCCKFLICSSQQSHMYSQTCTSHHSYVILVTSTSHLLLAKARVLNNPLWSVMYLLSGRTSTRSGSSCNLLSIALLHAFAHPLCLALGATLERPHRHASVLHHLSSIAQLHAFAHPLWFSPWSNHVDTRQDSSSLEHCVFAHPCQQALCPPASNYAWCRPGATIDTRHGYSISWALCDCNPFAHLHRLTLGNTLQQSYKHTTGSQNFWSTAFLHCLVHRSTLKQ